MNDLEVCKAIAELEGKTGFQMHKGNPCVAKHDGWATLIEYNPISDLALNCMLRDKYEVSISHYSRDVYITSVNGNIIVGFESINDIPRAVCECVLMSTGEYE